MFSSDDDELVCQRIAISLQKDQTFRFGGHFFQWRGLVVSVIYHAFKHWL